MTLDASSFVESHYRDSWRNQGMPVDFRAGPINELPKKFKVLEFAPTNERAMWTYATCGMSSAERTRRIELHMFTSEKCIEVVEVLYAVSHFHVTGPGLDLNHTVNFGKPWINRSPCEYGLISLPYLDGPDLENLELDRGQLIKFYWLIPIHKAEMEHKRQFGIDALEEAFERTQFNFLDERRPPVC